MRKCEKGEIIYHFNRNSYYRIKYLCKVKQEDGSWLDGYVYECCETHAIYARPIDWFNKNFVVSPNCPFYKDDKGAPKKVSLWQKLKRWFKC